MYPELKNLYKRFDREPVVEDLNLSLEKRPVSTVFQSYGLFPHMTVLQNVICGLKFKGVKKADAVEIQPPAVFRMRPLPISGKSIRKPNNVGNRPSTNPSPPGNMEPYSPFANPKEIWYPVK